MLCQLGLRYDTDEAIEQAGHVVEAIKLWAYEESANLAAEKGRLARLRPPHQEEECEGREQGERASTLVKRRS
jgi:ribonucleotide reductase alpha subunit